MKNLRKLLKISGREYNEGEIKKPCVVCGHETPHRIVHKELKKEFPFCLQCRSNGYYNEKIFDTKDYREPYKG